MREIETKFQSSEMVALAERMGFDPEVYARRNADLAEAGPDLLSHWFNHGRSEERRGLRPSWRLDGFSAALYEKIFPDVAELVAAGDYVSAEEHWVAMGRREVAAGTRVAIGIPTDNLRGDALAAKVQDWLCGGATRAALSARLHGAQVQDVRAIEWIDDDIFALTGADGWFSFSPNEQAAEAEVFDELLIQWEVEDSARPYTGQLFIDYGEGVGHSTSITFGALEDANKPVVLRLAEPWRIRSLRLDPDHRSNRMSIRNLRYRTGVPLLELGELALKTGRDAPPRDLGSASDSAPDPDSPIARSRAWSTLYVPRDPDYHAWVKRWASPSPADQITIRRQIAEMARRPTFSFILPVHNPPVQFLTACLDSLLTQSYPDFEVCIADDASTDPEVIALLASYAERDPRIRLTRRRYNGHISAASNTALSIAQGEFVVLVDHDDLIPDYCLFVVAQYLNAHPSARILFSDEDKLTTDGFRFEPYFKGAFDPWLLYGHNMVSHLGVYDRLLVEEIAGFRLGLEGSQDYDLTLRAMEKVALRDIVHIPHILYHWRTAPGSTAIAHDQKGYAIRAAVAAINGHFERTGIELLARESVAGGVTEIGPTRQRTDRVSIIIPTRDGVNDLSACLASIQRYEHDNVEIIVVDNQSSDPEALLFLAEQESQGAIRVLRYDAPFNFSALNNFAAARASGDILCFLNNDTEVRSRDWLNRARSLLALPNIGAVGARLYYPDDTLQHFGITLGMGEHRVAAHPHLGTPRTLGGYFSKASLIQSFSAVTAACLFMRKETFDRAGGFEPELPVAYNDVDLCLKIGDLGLRILADPGIELTHKESRTRGSDLAPEAAMRLSGDAAWMHSRWGSRLQHDPYFSPNHDLDRPDFALANPPRLAMPWQERPVTNKSFSAGGVS